MYFRFLPILVFSAALAVISCTPADPEPAEAPPPVRLVELVEGAEIDWPRLKGEEKPSWLHRARIGQAERPLQVVQMPMFAGPDNRDSRVAIVAPSGASYRFGVTLPPAPHLRSGLGYVIESGHAGIEVHFEIALETPAGERHVLLDRWVQIEELGGWEEVEVSLESWAGHEVVLELSTARREGDPLVWAGFAAPEIASTEGREKGWDVVLISLDTLRADRLGSYGHRRATSPHLDAFAAEGVRFATAISQSPWTRPSHRSLFTGLHPISRGGLESPALAWVFWLDGYRTRAVTGGGQIDDRFGFHDGFERYEVKDWLHDQSEVLAHLEAGRDRRDFLFLHTFEIHDPYTHHEIARAEGLDPGRIEDAFDEALWRQWNHRLSEAEQAYVEALYDGGIAHTDRRLGLFFGELEKRGLLERTIVVVTSDHGEELFDHGGWRHGNALYEHQVHVPLIFHLPEELEEELAERVIEDQVRLIDVYPTLLDLAGIELGHEIQGRSLRPFLEGRPLAPAPALSENTNARRYERKSLRTGRLKLIHSYPRGAESHPEMAERQLFDLARDPAELRDLAAERPDVLGPLEEQLLDLLQGADPELFEETVPEDLDPDLRRRLEALGYL